MLELLKKLCLLDGTSGSEDNVRNFIIEEIKGFCEYKVDNLGNIICFKKGKKQSSKRLMLDAHMDEVGLIITAVTSDGFLKFDTVGGMDASVLAFKTVEINDILGVISSKPVHLLSKDEQKKPQKVDALYIDIGATSKEEALSLIRLGDTAVIQSDFTVMGENIKAKAIDDRIGCAVLIKLLKEKAEYDYYAVFSTQEEIGTRGAKVAAFAVDPDFALILEATTAADIAGVSDEKSVCNLGEGPVVSFMDRATAYDRALYNTALNSGLSVQPKRAVAGGNNSGAIHLSREGVRTLAISLPCRYIHSPSCVANVNDMENMIKLTKYMLNGILSGEIK
ncbi:MAG: M42 family peptidase [Clostridia bacterium]|nr:M42 family peptidase [Clostridia bacterium]